MAQNPFEAHGPQTKAPGGLASQGPEWMQDRPPRSPNAPGHDSGRPGIRQIDQKLPPLPKLVQLMRLTNIIISILIAVICVLKLMVLSSVTTGIVAIYLILFSCMVAGFELQVKAVVRQIGGNFGFLYNAKGRALFFLFIGFLAISLGFFGFLLGLAMIVNAAFNFYIIFKYPQYEEIALRSLEEETSAYLAQRPEMVMGAAAAVAKAAAKSGGSSSHGQGVPV
mmetsp:Transcript_19756/g.27196  ORF Transcript_19756/g.27196 Transcript_19756/m.27196 type:complete len:224 (+) Transcript_19756:97-768(+)